MWKWFRPIEGEIPQALTKSVLEPYILGIRPLLAKSNMEQQLFLNRSGTPFTAAGFSTHFTTM